MPDDSRLPEKVEAVLLDAGGVLLDLDYAYLRRLVGARGYDVAKSALASAEALARREQDRHTTHDPSPGESWRGYFSTLLGHVGVKLDEHAGIIDSLWEAHRRHGLWTVAVGGAVESVACLKQAGYRLAVVSNAEGQVARDLDSAGFGDMFETVVDSHLVGVRKPDPAIFGIALERMGGLDADSAVFLGDLPNVDVGGARAAGLAPILLDRFDLYAEIDAPRLRSFDELPGLLEVSGVTGRR